MNFRNDVTFYLPKKNGWKNFSYKNYKIFIKGFLYNANNKKFLNLVIQNLIIKKNLTFFNNNYGEYTLVIYSKNFKIILSDPSRTFPIYFYKEKNTLCVSDDPKKIQEKYNLIKLNKDMVKIALMSGYTIGRYTIYEKVYTINAGEIVEFIKEKTESSYYSDIYRNKAVKKNYNQYKYEYLKILNDIFLDLKKKIGSKNIYLALSAGDDSKLVLSMLKKLNFKNVTCFSYGLKNNWESLAAKTYAKKLGYNFKFIPIESNIMINFFKSRTFKKYFNKMDYFDSTPSLHEIYVIDQIRRVIKKNSVILNGQPADAFNGSYLPKNFLYKPQNKNLFLEAVIKKHYSLWINLVKYENIKLIKKYVINDLNKYFKMSKVDNYKKMLFTSYQNRVCKYLHKNTQVYSYFNFETYTPYKDPRFLKFWSSVPNNHHYKRSLSKAILQDLNFFNLWINNKSQKNFHNSKTKILRFFLKLLFIFSKSKWKIFDKRFFGYKNDNQLKTHIIDKNEWKKSKNHRSSVSFLTIKWLNNHNNNLTKTLLDE